MANPFFWKNVSVAIQTALAAAQSISAITKAATGVVTYVGSDVVVNGDYVLMSANGMTQVGDRIFRAANVNAAANTFELEGEDTQAYDTFTTGSFQIITFGANFNNLQTIQVSGGDPEYADVTTIHDAIRKRAPTVVSPMTLSSDAIFDVSDLGFKEANKAYKSSTKRACMIGFPGGQRFLLNGFWSAPGMPTGQAQGVVQTRISCEGQNFPNFYAS